MIRWPRILVLATTFLWAMWWSYFSIAVGMGVAPGLPQALLPMVVAVLLFLGSAFVAWRWPLVGGPLLTLEGALLLVWVAWVLQNPRSTTLLLVTLLALPPLLSGLMLLACRRGLSRSDSVEANT